MGGGGSFSIPKIIFSSVKLDWRNLGPLTHCEWIGQQNVRDVFWPLLCLSFLSHLTMLQTNDCWNYEEQRRHRCGCCYDCAGFCRGFWGHRIQTIRGQKASTQVVIAHSPARYFAPSRSLGCRNSKTFEWLLRPWRMPVRERKPVKRPGKTEAETGKKLGGGVEQQMRKLGAPLTQATGVVSFAYACHWQMNVVQVGMAVGNK